jgi:hypothetical protein
LNSCKLKLVKRDYPRSPKKKPKTTMLGLDLSPPTRPQGKVTPRERRKRRIKKIKRTRRRRKIRGSPDQTPRRRTRSAHPINPARTKKAVSESRNQV